MMILLQPRSPINGEDNLTLTEAFVRRDLSEVYSLDSVADAFIYCSFLEPSASVGECRHQLWTS